MMTIVTHLQVKSGQEPAWDAAFRERVEVAKEQLGFVGVQLCIPIDAMSERVIIGTWQSRADWEAWHNADAFRQTREQMEEADTKQRKEWWHEVVLEERR